MGSGTQGTLATRLSEGPDSDCILLDDALQRYHFREVHSIVVRATLAQTRWAICRLTPSELLLVPLLFSLRALPTRLRGGGPPPVDSTRPLLAELHRAGFVALAEAPPREIVLGVVGQFWRLSGNRPLSLASAD